MPGIVHSDLPILRRVDVRHDDYTATQIAEAYVLNQTLTTSVRSRTEGAPDGRVERLV